MAAKRAAGKKKTAKKTSKKAAGKKAAGEDECLLEVSSKGTTKSDTIVKTLPRDAIKIVKGFNPRETAGDVKELASNIKKNGLLNYPVVRPSGKAGEYSLVAGERRIMALDSLGRKTVPCAIRTDLEGDDDRAQAVSVAENAEEGRFNLNPIEIGRVCHGLAQKGWTTSRIANETGLHISKVRRTIAIVEAPKDVLQKVQKGELGLYAGLELAKLDDKTRKKIKDSLSVNAGRNEIKKAAKAAAKAEGVTPDPGKKQQQQKGVARAAGLTAWRGSKLKQSKLAELCHYIATAEKSEVGTIDYHELRGAVGYALWDRGDLDDPILPSLEPDDKEEKKQLTVFNGLVEKESAKFTPPDPDEDDDE